MLAARLTAQHAALCIISARKLLTVIVFAKCFGNMIEASGASLRMSLQLNSYNKSIICLHVWIHDENNLPQNERETQRRRGT